MGFADLHIHSIYSHDATGSIPAILKFVADHTHLNVIALTDHDSLRGNAEAVQQAPRYGLEVIPGCEISTADGHLLALFIKDPIPAGLSLIESALRVGDQGGLCVVPHPMARGTSSVNMVSLRRALTVPPLAKVLVGVEIYNGGLVYTRSNQTVRAMAHTLPLAQVGNSDSHILSTIGQGSTEFPGRSAVELREALLARTTIPHEGVGLTGIRALREWAPRFVLRKLGWVAWNASPEAPLKMVRLSRAVN
jgi:predicted metal-dependent phosphoesterase TrpH